MPCFIYSITYTILRPDTTYHPFDKLFSFSNISKIQQILTLFFKAKVVVLYGLLIGLVLYSSIPIIEYTIFLFVSLHLLTSLDIITSSYLRYFLSFYFYGSFIYFYIFILLGFYNLNPLYL